MAYQLNLICNEDGSPRKFVEIDEELLKKEQAPVDGLLSAFQTKTSPIQMSPATSASSNKKLAKKVPSLAKSPIDFQF